MCGVWRRELHSFQTRNLKPETRNLIRYHAGEGSARKRLDPRAGGEGSVLVPEEMLQVPNTSPPRNRFTILRSGCS